LWFENRLFERSGTQGAYRRVDRRLYRCLLRALSDRRLQRCACFCLFSSVQARARAYIFHGSDESIASTWERLDVSGSIRIVPQRCPDLIDCEIQPLLEIDESLAPPYLLLNLFSGNQLARMGGEQDQNFERLRWKANQDSGFAQLTAPEVQFKGPKPQQRQVSCACTHGTTRGKRLIWPPIIRCRWGRVSAATCRKIPLHCFGAVNSRNDVVWRPQILGPQPKAIKGLAAKLQLSEN
jgi:hypothetical protein